VNTTVTRLSCERIGILPSDARDPAKSPWSAFEVDLSVTQHLRGAELPKLVLQLGEEWCGWANLANAIQIVRRRADAALLIGEGLFLNQIEWPSQTNLVRSTELDFSAAINVLDDETEAYIQRLQLRDAVAWLQATVPAFFPGTEYEIGVLPAEDGEDAILALRVYGAMSAAAFREKRHAICQAMLDEGHRGLYEVISIFQRKAQASGRQVFSHYSAVLAY